METLRGEALFLTICAGGCLYICLFYFVVDSTHQLIYPDPPNLSNPKRSATVEGVASNLSHSQLKDFDVSADNYFRYSGKNGSTSFTGSFLVDQHSCRIPEVNLWTNEAREDYKPNSPTKPALPCLVEGVEGSIPGLSFVRKGNLVINEDLLKRLNIPRKYVDCCYRQISQSLHAPYNTNIEKFKLKTISNSCIPINGSSVVPNSNSIEVTCVRISKRGGFTEIHRDFHILANILLPEPTLTRKLDFWRNKTEFPPNVYILGIDSGSRMNIRRQMPHAVKYLKDLGATEMLGYTKVGPNTYSNMIPFLTSQDDVEAERTCKFTSSVVVDHCPMIFRSFSDANYVTNYLEDSNSLKSGRDAFLNPPTDFYHIIWMRYLHNQGLPNAGLNMCVENKTIYQSMIDFNQNFAEVMTTNKLPYFSFTFMGGVAHSYFNGAQDIDRYFTESLKYLNNSGYLDNTFVILMADHGYRTGRLRRSIAGWYEVKQPVLWIRIPPKLSQQRPEFKQALEFNANQLSSPFDLHETLKHLAAGKKIDRSSRGISFFEKLEDRNCSAAGIPLPYCPCTVLLPFHDMDRPLLKLAAISALEVKNFSVDSLPKGKVCKKFEVDEIIAAAVMGDSFQDSVTDNQLEDMVVSGKTYLVLGLRTHALDKKALMEFILQYEERLSPAPFQALYSFGVDGTKCEKLVTLGYHECK